MRYDPQRHHRRSIRLRGYDYTAPGAYFVTFCTHRHRPILGEIVDAAMNLSLYGCVVQSYLTRLPDRFPHVKVDTWMVMPNHVHALLIIVEDRTTIEQQAVEYIRAEDDPCPDPKSKTISPLEFESPTGWKRRRQNASLLQPPSQPRGAISGSLSAIVSNLKSITARRINRIRHTPGQPVWQRNYWEHIIRDEHAYHRIRQYIDDNPAHWQEDQLHPDAPDNPFNQGRD